MTNSMSTTRERLWAGAEFALGSGIVMAANLTDLVPVNETPWLIAMAWASLWWRRARWKDVGFRQPVGWGRTLGLALVLGALYQLTSEYVTEPLVQRLTGAPIGLEDFRWLAGNLPAALGMLLVVWTLAAFGEEVAYRGVLLQRGAAALGGGSVGYAIGLVTTGVLFGVAHYYQGPAGVIGSMLSGLFFGALYLASGRNLWLPILTHGISDTIGLGLIYFGYLG